MADPAHVSGIDWDEAALSASPARSAEVVEEIAQWLHDEGGFGDSYPDLAWPDHPDDDGRRDGGYVRLVPKHAQAHFRDVARRFVGRFVLAATLQSAQSEISALTNIHACDMNDIALLVLARDDEKARADRAEAELARVTAERDEARSIALRVRAEREAALTALQSAQARIAELEGEVATADAGLVQINAKLDRLADLFTREIGKTLTEAHDVQL